VSGGGEAVRALQAQYRTLVVEWDEARDNPKQANRIFDEVHGLYKDLRRSEDGRLAIAGLLDDPITGVRLSAATHALGWQPERAAAVLEEIEQEDNLHAVSAKWTLRSFRAGKLDLDW
jgi:Holliday junction resolvasome RuvABC DNA-binding subunit